MEPAIIVIDQGTSATKVFVFDGKLQVCHSEKIRHEVSRPRPGWVESDPAEILTACNSLIARAMHACASASITPVAVGLAFQRSTFLFWDKRTAAPLTAAMSWQDTRAAQITETLSDHREPIQHITGIPLSPHFGAPKFLFSVRRDPDLRWKINSGNTFFGPLSAFVTQGLIGSPLVDHSIAGRSLILNLKKMMWDNSLMDLFEMPHDCVPPLAPTCAALGVLKIGRKKLPLRCVIGDQQASLIGQGRWHEGNVAMNFGTSGSVLVNSGERPIIVPSLLSNVLYSLHGERRFLLEGTVNSVSSIFKWLENYLGIPHEEMKWEDRCLGTTAGVLVPGLDGISSPYWTNEFETAIFGLSESDHPNDFVRAGMESIGLLVNDICEIIREEGRIEVKDVIASGGSSRPPLLQFIADLLDTPVLSSAGKDMTALGVAGLVARQIWDISTDETGERGAERFLPSISHELRKEKVSAWRNALRKLGIISNNKGGE